MNNADPVCHEHADLINAKTELIPAAEMSRAISRLVEDDPEGARQLLVVLQSAVKSRRHETARRVLDAIAVLGDSLAEAIGPTTLKTQPASLEEAWAAVGRLIRNSMDEVGRRLEHHGG